MTANDDQPSDMLAVLLDEVSDGDRHRASNLRWADRMLREYRIGLIATLALRGIDDRYPVDMLRLREAIRSGRRMTAQEARLRLVQRQLRIGRHDHQHPDANEAVRCLQAWIAEATAKEIEWEQ